METLIELMKKVLAETFCFYLKCHNFHWNVEGPDFSEYHAFFGGLYEEVFDAIDPIAEKIRTLDAYAPGSLQRFLELSEIKDATTIPDAKTMVTTLYNDNKIVLKTLQMAAKFAEKEDQQGLLNYLTERIDIHEKHNWMLRSIIK